MKLSKITLAALLAASCLSTQFLGQQIAQADRPAKEELREKVPVQSQPPAQTVPAVSSACRMRLSAGFPAWFYQDEHDTTMPGAYFDYWCPDLPLNYRVGIEGRHMDISQDGTEALAEFPGKAVETTYVRIPFALEYYQGIADDVTWYAGIGPDIIHMNNDASDTSVGFHVGTRLQYSFTDNWGVALEGGYMWGSLKDQGVDINLDGAYINPTINYTF